MMSDFAPSIPVIRRMMPQIMAEQIVNVQPIELPQGFVFPLSVSPSADYRTETEKYLERIGVE